MRTVSPAAVAASEAGLFVVPGPHADTARKLAVIGDVAGALPPGRAAWNLLNGLPSFATAGRPDWRPQDFADHAVALCRPLVFMEVITPAQAAAACVIATVTTVVASLHCLPGEDSVRARLADLDCGAGDLAVLRGILVPAAAPAETADCPP